MINPDAPTEVLPGFLRSDLQFLADCLEGKRGEGRRAEAAPRAAAFIRAALAARPAVPALERPYERLARIAGVGEAPQPQPDLVLSDSERRMIEKQRAHAERNHGDDSGDEGLPS